jgi:dolichol-phosphate mannosyltransferase
MVVDLLVYAALLRVSLGVELGRAMAILLAMTWNFFLNRRLTFSYSRSGRILIPYLKFVMTCVLGAIVSWSVSVGLTRGLLFFKHHLFLAAIVGIVAGTACNFLISMKWVFRQKQPSS